MEIKNPYACSMIRTHKTSESLNWGKPQQASPPNTNDSIARHYRDIVTNHLVWTFRSSTGPEGEHFKAAEIAAEEWAEYTPNAEARELLGSCVGPAHRWLNANGSAPTVRKWRRWKKNLFGSTVLKGQFLPKKTLLNQAGRR